MLTWEAKDFLLALPLIRQIFQGYSRWWASQLITHLDLTSFPTRILPTSKSNKHLKQINFVKFQVELYSFLTCVILKISTMKNSQKIFNKMYLNNAKNMA